MQSMAPIQNLFVGQQNFQILPARFMSLATNAFLPDCIIYERSNYECIDPMTYC